jgi:hypothetical protein
MLFVGGLRVQELKTEELARQLHVGHTVDAVD